MVGILTFCLVVIFAIYTGNLTASLTGKNCTLILTENSSSSYSITHLFQNAGQTSSKMIRN